MSDYKVIEVLCDYETPRYCIFEWVAGCGFGQLSFRYDANDDGRLENIQCDNECMSRELCTAVLTHYAARTSKVFWPQLLRQFESPDALLKATKPDWPIVANWK